MRANAATAGLADKYHVLTCGAEAQSLVPALAKEGLLGESVSGSEGGVFDTIIAARVLCGVPDLQHSLEVLYGLLKPGGRFLIVEHVRNPWWRDGSRGGVVGSLIQVVSKPFWEFFLRCRLDADTEGLLMGLGGENWAGWESVQLAKRVEWAPLPWIGGMLVKKSK